MQILQVIYAQMLNKIPVKHAMMLIIVSQVNYVEVICI